MEQTILSSETLIRFGSDMLAITPATDSNPASNVHRDIHFEHVNSRCSRVSIKGAYVADVFYAESDNYPGRHHWYIDGRIAFAITGRANLGKYRSRDAAENAVVTAWTAKLRKDGAW